jgi:2,4-dienoyl-CoA reductase (NADPH2)
MHFPHIFQEGRIGSAVLRNRLIMSLYPTKYATDSKVNERMIEFYRERARGGVAMIVLVPARPSEDI